MELVVKGRSVIGERIGLPGPGRSRRIVVASVLVLALVGLGAGPASAKTGGGSASGSTGGTAGGTSTPTGIDVSYPQCNDTLPTTKAFALVGVNGGLANDYNSCLASQLSYAEALPGGTSQPVAQVYVNTGDPGASVADWPYGTNSGPSSTPGLGSYSTASSTGATPYGTCASYTSSAACAYVYGYDMVAGIGTIKGDIATLGGATIVPASSFRWWLDVETGNSWQSNQTMNVADLQGMVYALTGSTVGIYSTAYQWNTITGTPGTSEATSTGSVPNTLHGLQEWLAGASSLSGARANCSAASFTGGTTAVTQWAGRPYDGDYSCP